MRLLSSAVVATVLSAAALAAPPRLEIPPEVRPTADYVTLVPTTDAVSVVYVSKDGLNPFPSAFLKDAKNLVIPTKGERPGKYRFTAVAAAKNGEQAVLDFTVVIGNPAPVPVPPNPNPNPTPGPDGKLGLTKVSRDGAAKINRPDADRAELAKAQRGVASAVAAGGLTQPADILKAWREANNAAVNPDVWREWGVAVSGALQKLFADGKLKDRDDWVTALGEIADGLEVK